MLASSIGSILVASGAITAAGGLTALLLPQPFLRLGFGVKSTDGVTVLFVRSWGVLVFVIGGLIVYSAYVPTARTPVLTAAAIEKFALVGLIFFGPVNRTTAMTAIAIIDGFFATLYVAYLARL
jgi:hypothetical protein